MPSSHFDWVIHGYRHSLGRFGYTMNTFTHEANYMDMNKKEKGLDGPTVNL